MPIIKKAVIGKIARLHHDGMLTLPAQILSVFCGVKPARVVIDIRQGELV
jgi:hypothetical protein